MPPHESSPNRLAPQPVSAHRPLVYLAAALGLTLAGCASTESPTPELPTLPVVEAENLDERALLLMLADRKSFEPLAVRQALGGDAGLRRLAALTLGRIGDSRGAATLEALLGDAAASVRRAAAFALGELAEQSNARAEQPLLQAAIDPDRETGRLAVEALAKIDVPLETVVAGLIKGASDELLPRLLPALFRFEGESVVRWAEQGLEQDDPEQRAMAAYALGRNPQAAGAPWLRQLLADGDPWIRSLAARGLGRVGDRDDLARLRTLLEDPEPGPIIQTLRSARMLIDDGKSAPPDDWRPHLLRLMTDTRPGVRLTAIEVSAVWLLDEELGAALAGFADSEIRRERELALLSLAEGEDPRAAVLLVRMAADPDPVLRARVAEAAGLFRATEVLEQLARDPDSGVRRSALDTRLAGAGDDGAPLVRAALEDPDPTVRATALGWAEEHPVVESTAILAGMSSTWRDRMPDARLAGIQALQARAAAVAAERDGIVALLEEAARDGDYLVRRQAARSVAELTGESLAVGTASGDKPVEVYRQIVQRTARPRRVELETERGTIGIELACPEAPLTCLNFLQLAAQGYYEGIAFHRVVPDFVVQAGDPRGDGWGGPGYAIRDEMNLLRYRRGIVGMALSGPDTGGSQFFITLAPQPHLDGGYTIFGRVVSGNAVLDQIIQGDRILRILESSAR